MWTRTRMHAAIVSRIPDSWLMTVETSDRLVQWATASKPQPKYKVQLLNVPVSAFGLQSEKRFRPWSLWSSSGTYRDRGEPGLVGHVCFSFIALSGATIVCYMMCITPWTRTSVYCDQQISWKSWLRCSSSFDTSSITIREMWFQSILEWTRIMIRCKRS